mgnify:FL=1
MSNFVNLMDVIYPVNSIYMSYSSTSPAASIGGTWSSVSGFIRAGSDTSTGGASTHKHSLDDGCRATVGASNGQPNVISYIATTVENNDFSQVSAYSLLASSAFSNKQNFNHHTRVYGNTTATSSLPPYQTLYVWRRTA